MGLETVDLVGLSQWRGEHQNGLVHSKRLTALSTSRFRKLKGEGTWSPTCLGRLAKLMVFPSKRAGVPV